MGPRFGPHCHRLRRETGSLDPRARLLVFRVGEILWDEGGGNTEAQTGDFASEIEKIGRNADDGSTQCFDLLRSEPRRIDVLLDCRLRWPNELPFGTLPCQAMAVSVKHHT